MQDFLDGRGHDAAKAAEQRLTDLLRLSGSNQYFWETNRRHEVTFVSPTLEDEILTLLPTWRGRTVEELLLALDLSNEQAESFLELLQNRKPFANHLLCFQATQGRSSHIVVASGMPIFDPRGDFAGFRCLAADVTQQKQVEMVLSSGLENMTDGVAFFDADDILVRCNQTYRQLSGVNEEELAPGISYEASVRVVASKLSDVALAGSAEDYVQRRMTEHSSGAASRTLHLSDGTWFRETDAPAGLGGTLVIRTDITDLKTAEQRALESERRFRALTNIGSDWFWQTDRNGRIKFLSENFYDLMGYHRDDVLDIAGADFVSQEEWAKHPEKWRRHLQTIKNCESFRDLEYAVDDKRGKTHYISVNGDPIFDGNGQFQGYQGTTRDVTERMAAERELRREQERLRHIFETAIVSLWEVDYTDMVAALDDIASNGVTDLRRYLAADRSLLEELIGMAKITRVNEAAVKLLGADSKTEVLEKIYTITEQMDDKFLLDEVVAVYERHPTMNVEWPLRNLKGEELVLFSSVSFPQRTEDYDRVIASVVDITELKQAELAMREAKERAEAATQAKTDFLSAMSHELRTPLNAILGYGQLLTMKSASNTASGAGDPVGDASQHIVDAGTHLLSMIDDLLDMSTIESGKISLQPVALTPREAVDEVLPMVADMAAKLNVEIRRAPFARGEISADPNRLRQVLVNLVSNAIKYNRPDGHVEVGCFRRGVQFLRLYVKDNGRGIPAAEQSEIFLQFSRAKHTAHEVAGTGIGLYHSKKLVEAMGGTIGFESEEGRGSTFFVEFPRAQPDAAQAVRPPTF